MAIDYTVTVRKHPEKPNQYILQIFYPKNRTKSILRIELCTHNFYPKNRPTKHSSILRIESYYTNVLTCLRCFVLYIQLIHNTLNRKYMMATQYYIILYIYINTII